jgi:hypothetical protein
MLLADLSGSKLLNSVWSCEEQQEAVRIGGAILFLSQQQACHAAVGPFPHTVLGRADIARPAHQWRSQYIGSCLSKRKLRGLRV